MFARFWVSLLIEFVVNILKPSISESLHDFMAFSFCSWFFPGILLPQTTIHTHTREVFEVFGQQSYTNLPSSYIRVFPKNRGIKWMVKIRESPIRIDDLGVTPIFGNTHIPGTTLFSAFSLNGSCCPHTISPHLQSLWTASKKTAAGHCCD